MTPTQIAKAERAAREEWQRLMTLTTEDQRCEALDAALDAFRGALAELGVPVDDYLARVALLDRALGELDERLEAAHLPEPFIEEDPMPMSKTDYVRLTCPRCGARHFVERADPPGIVECRCHVRMSAMRVMTADSRIADVSDQLSGGPRP